jgi:hypothetical protein
MLKNNKNEASVNRPTRGRCVAAVVSLAAVLILTASGLPAATTINAKSASQSDVASAIASAADGDTVAIPSGTASWTHTLQVKKGITIQGAGVGVTIIKDSVQSGQLIQWTLAAGYQCRLTGIEFQDGGRANRQSDVLRVVGSNTDGSLFRFDHCKWNNVNGAGTFDTVIGVIDHNTFILDRTGLPINIYGSYWNGQTLGDGSWAAATDYGSSQFLFIEDNTFTHTQQSQQGITDAYAGARFVVRHNNIFNGLVSNHGTESTGRVRGCRAVEVYNNSYTGTGLNRFVGGVRSGGVLFHDNTISGYSGNLAEFSLQNYRSFHVFAPWGGADGTNRWDKNQPNAFFTGRAAANSSGTTVTVSGNPNWRTNQWVGYTIRRTTDVCGTGTQNYSWIASNTANSITYAGNALYPKELDTSFCSGDSLEIRKIDHALDQPGTAGGSLINGDPPVEPRHWNDQVIEPCYSWNNTNEVNGQVNFGAGPGVIANVHFFNDTPMPGYTPYIYPHPLTKGLPLPDQMTRKPKGTSQHHVLKERQPWGGIKVGRRKAKNRSGTDEMAEGQHDPGN